MAEHINKTDTLNEGRVKLNEAINDSNIAKVKSESADVKATQALEKSTSTQTQLDTIVIDGDSSVEAAQARVDEKGVSHPTLKARIDDGMNSVNQQLAENVTFLENDNNVKRYFYTNEPMISFTFDDGRDTDWTRFKPIFESEGVPGNICLITDRVGNNNFMGINQIKELKEMGWTVASHTATHPRLTELTGSQLTSELVNSQNFLREHGLDHDILVYPYGNHNDLVRRHARRYYNYAIDIDINVHPNTVDEFENIRIPRISGLSQPRSYVSLEYCKSMVDEAKATGDWKIFEDHSHYEYFADPANLDKLRELIQYAKSQGVPIVSIREGLERRANIIEIDNYSATGTKFIVNRNGGIRSNQLFHIYDNDKKFDDPIHKFKLNHVTHTSVPTNKAIEQGFPEQTGGRFETNYFTHESYALQTYHINGSSRKYSRYWLTNEDAWSEFELVSSYIKRLPPNSYLADSPISDFENYRTTVNVVTIMNGFPTENSNGLLTTKRDGIFNRQILETGFETCFRYALSSGNWSAFRKVALEEV